MPSTKPEKARIINLDDSSERPIDVLFNPNDPAEPRKRLAISVEDVQAYRDFVSEQYNSLGGKDGGSPTLESDFLRPFLQRLVECVHPLALGNVHRVHIQIRQLAKRLLEHHSVEGRNTDEIVDALTTRFYSHLHMINRHEARDILGEEQVKFARTELAQLLDELLRQYDGARRKR